VIQAAETAEGVFHISIKLIKQFGYIGYKMA
jgi:hypothetical protein